MSGEGPPPTKRGYVLGDVVSALQKSVRRGQEEAAVYWALEMDASGYTAYAFRRLAVIASEDCYAEPMAAVMVASLRSSWEAERQNRKGARGLLYVAHAASFLARAKKSRIADHLLMVAGENAERREIPDEAYDVHTREGRRRGRGWRFFYENSGLVADRETGELGRGCLDDPYWERARATVDRKDG